MKIFIFFTSVCEKIHILSTPTLYKMQAIITIGNNSKDEYFALFNKTRKFSYDFRQVLPSF